MSQSLPIDPLLPSIVAAVQNHNQVILTATPGAGKTTRLPPALLSTVKGKIAVLEPRRMATVAASQRVAEEQKWNIGDEVGYQVRFESKLTPATRLVFMTDALLLRRMVDDPELKNFDLIVIDEFHERNLNQDIILGLIKELQELGSPIKLLIMSATLDVGRLQKFLPDSHHIDVPGKVFPLEVRYSSQTQKLQTDNDFFARTTEIVIKACNSTDGDVLVFLPGQGEINRLHDLLETKKTNRTIWPLHGSLSLQDQKNILLPHAEPRIILSTNIAEASVTVPGVDTVVDTGLAKIMQVNISSGFSRLELSRISQFSAKQRAGRAARQKSGTCWRLWTEHEDITQSQETPPECQRVDLAPTLLLLAHLGISDFKNFSWFDLPPVALLNMAEQSLKNINALDEKNIITSHGKKLLLYPLPPRWGELLALAETHGSLPLLAKTAALLQDRDIVLNNHEAHSNQECDVSYRLQLLEEVQKNRRPNGVHLRQAQQVLEAADQLQRLVPKTRTPESPPEALHRVLLISQSDRLCRRRKGSDRGLMVGGRGVKLAKESQVKQSEFFLSLQGIDFPNQPETTISIATGLTKQFVLDTLGDQIQLVEDIYFDEQKGQFFSRKVRKFKDLEIDEPSLSRLQSHDLGDKFVDVLVSKWAYIIEHNDKLQKMMQRWDFFIKHSPEFSDEISPDNVRQTLEMAAFGKTKIEDVLAQDIVGFLESTMDKPCLKQFNKEAPDRFLAPSGFQHAIHYSASENPFVEIRLQEVFGLTQTPLLASGKVPLTFKLLGPNFRPVQVTSDISGFWQRAYVEVRKELRSKYPKHSWPDDPLTAVPVAKGSRRK